MIRSKTLRIASGSLLTALVLSACTPADPQAETSKALVDGVLLPSYTQWAEADRRLAASAIAYCADNQTTKEAQEAFVHAQTAWAGLQPLLIGPMGEGNLAWQVQFWPDKKNLVARQVTALLNAKPNLSQADLDGASVVVQGLSAYEYILFDKGIDLADSTSKARYCPLLIAIGEHQQQLAAGVLQQWQDKDGMADQLRRFPNERYAEPSEAIAELLRVQVTALDGLKKKLGAPLGRQAKGHPQPYQAEGWRSDTTLANIAAAIKGAESLWLGADKDGLRELLGAEQADLAKRIDAGYAELLQQLTGITQPFGELLSSETGRGELDALYQRIDRLHRLHQLDLARALGVQIGFNAHDGD
ncbi:imelysin [Stutzerimonas decontaminans]|uniref:Imelysin n=1 Tax=Stutzerimonas decontaminans TaxID=3022791 RepID=A0ABX4W3W6_9GAMM|nr:imelysin family protein [Stutzerimonas decontaminans]MCQ4244218.1 imelysin [Stutzerimonas decontaminans]PNF86216.1 imelysin [Stutzerimonas decontaminans]